jgi:peptide deformylase
MAGMKKLLTIVCFCATLLAFEKINMERIDPPPQYLYKILSLKNWQATQNRKAVQLSADDDTFVHFSTENQLDRIIQKYWPDAPQLVILKINTEQLKGDLVFEANPGGTTKYYHLYDGFIPFNAIVEAKIEYRQPISTSELEKLNIVQIGDPLLRQVARELSVQEILSPEIQELITMMKATMRAAPGVGLAAPQIGKSIQLAVIEDVNHDHLTPEQLSERNRYPVPFHVIINPRLYIEETTETQEFHEGCLSVPEFLGVVPRAESVRVECLNEKGEPIVIQANGWYARILQHEIDHLNGALYIDKVKLPTLTTAQNYIQHQPK